VSKRFKGKICVYCVKNLSTNQGDHIFAREFFLPNRRQNLPKVPACKQCNGDKSKLEHYLTSILPFGGRHGDARSNIELVPKRLAKNARLRETIASLPGFGMAPVGHLSYSAAPNMRVGRTQPCSVQVHIDPIPPKG